MKIEFWVIGKTNEAYLQEGANIYLKRLKHYLPFHFMIIPDLRNRGKLHPDKIKAQEADSVLQKLKSEDFLILLDENGKEYSSEAFATFIDRQMQTTYKRIIFLVGGAFGFSDTLYKRSNHKMSLSRMTFSHQMVRVFFLEQLYRAMTILRNEPYHNP